jgi:hypothetical protein
MRPPIAFFVVAPLITISAVAAQDQQPGDWGLKNVTRAVPTGDAGVKFDQVAEYKPLTFWSKVALGSYFFTNSAAAHNIEIVYAYKPDELKANQDPNEIMKLLKEGTIKVGVERKDNRVVGYSLSKGGDHGDDKALSEFVKKSAQGDVVYLAVKQDLLGAAPTGALYTTGAPKWANQ